MKCKTILAMKFQDYEEHFKAYKDLAVGPDAILLSLPSPFAYQEGLKHVKKGKNIVVFGDDLSIEEELKLKREARKTKSWVLTPHTYANSSQKGRVGLIATAGAGLQQVVALINNLDCGTSTIISSGSRDFSDEIGGLQTMAALDFLKKDPETKVIALILKPLNKKNILKLIDYLKDINKKTILYIVGSNLKLDGPLLETAFSLEDLSIKIVEFLKNKKLEPLVSEKTLKQLAKKERAKLGNKQKFIRGLFSGGTFCDESVTIIQKYIGTVYSNISLAKIRLKDTKISKGHCCWDMSQGFYTEDGPYYPMVKMDLRGKRIIQEALDPETAVILFDVCLGYGSHLTPANLLINSINQIRKKRIGKNKRVSFIASVVGTKTEPQDLKEQINILKRAGVIVAPSISSAAKLASYIVQYKNLEV